ncbi:MAG: AAA domain-containing protein [Acidimicrobiales bacterium]
MQQRPRFRPGMGNTSQRPVSQSTIRPSTKDPSPKPLVPGSVTAKVIARIWRGGELTVVDSPPGAGKTALVVTAVAHLAMRAGMKVLIGTPTRAQGAALLARLHQEMPMKYLESGINDALVLPGIPEQGSNRECRVRVSTLAKCKLTKDRNDFDVFVVDEAYQATNAIVSAAASGVHQVLMVGDPGQIGPVVTVDTSIWRGMKNAPHLSAPEALGEYTDTERMHLAQSWRLGPVSTAAIAPVYPFPFSSANVARSATLGDGTSVNEIEAIEVPHAETVDDLVALSTVVNRVRDLAGGQLSLANSFTGEVEQREVRESDIAIIVSRNSQVSIATGLLQQYGLSGVSIGTADRLQGDEWPIVIALDPMLGSSDEQSEHNLSVGRLCVMASRHNTHFTWVHDDSWVAATNGNNATDRIGRAVRQALVKTGVSMPAVQAVS